MLPAAHTTTSPGAAAEFTAPITALWANTGAWSRA